jgi:hypothetical protein
MQGNQSWSWFWGMAEGFPGTVDLSIEILKLL